MVLATGRRRCLLRRRPEEEGWSAAARGELAVPINGLSFFFEENQWSIKWKGKIRGKGEEYDKWA